MKKNKVLETHIVTGILQYLKYKYPRSFFWRQNTMGVPTKAGGFRPAPVKGVSDIIGCHNGQMIAIEVKTPQGKLTDDQSDFLEAVRCADGYAFVARCIEDVDLPGDKSR